MRTLTVTLDALTRSLQSGFSGSNTWLAAIPPRQLLDGRGGSVLAGFFSQEQFTYFPRDAVQCEQRYIPLADFHRNERYRLSELVFSIECRLLRRRVDGMTALCMHPLPRWLRWFVRSRFLQISIRIDNSHIHTRLMPLDEKHDLCSGRKGVRWIILLNDEQAAGLHS